MSRVEIENVLLQHPDVREAAVIASATPPAARSSRPSSSLPGRGMMPLPRASGLHRTRLSQHE